MQHELEDALISCNSQVENLEKEIEEQRRYYQSLSVKFFLHLFSFIGFTILVESKPESEFHTNNLHVTYIRNTINSI